jgi:tocopherol O-methyltransferase
LQLHSAANHQTTALSVAGIRDHYDKFAWAYRLFWGEHIHHGLFTNGKDQSRRAQTELLRLCAGRAGVVTGSTVIDVGCGHGGTARFLAREYACSVLGLTISATQYRIAQRLSRSMNHRGSVRFEMANAETYRFPPESLDLVWNMESSEHFFDKPSYFRNVAGALKPGGRLMVAAWNGSMEHQLVREIAEVFLCPELLTAEQYSQCFIEAGMTLLSCSQVAAQVAPTWDICAKRLGAAGPLMAVLPDQYRSFVDGIQLMQRGYGSGELSYSILVAEKR